MFQLQDDTRSVLACSFSSLAMAEKKPAMEDFRKILQALCTLPGINESCLDYNVRALKLDTKTHDQS